MLSCHSSLREATLNEVCSWRDLTAAALSDRIQPPPAGIWAWSRNRWHWGPQHWGPRRSWSGAELLGAGLEEMSPDEHVFFPAVVVACTSSDVSDVDRLFPCLLALWERGCHPSECLLLSAILRSPRLGFLICTKVIVRIRTASRVSGAVHYRVPGFGRRAVLCSVGFQQRPSPPPARSQVHSSFPAVITKTVCMVAQCPWGMGTEPPEWEPMPQSDILPEIVPFSSWSDFPSSPERQVRPSRPVSQRKRNTFWSWERVETGNRVVCQHVSGRTLPRRAGPWAEGLSDLGDPASLFCR